MGERETRFIVLWICFCLASETETRLRFRLEDLEGICARLRTSAGSDLLQTRDAEYHGENDETPPTPTIVSLSDPDTKATSNTYEEAQSRMVAALQSILHGFN